MQAGPVLRFDPFRLDPGNARLWRGRQLIALTPKAFAVLCSLVEHAGQLMTKDALLTAVWPEVYVSEGVLSECVREVRKALGDTPQAPRFIQTVHRRGYRFIGKVASRQQSGVRRRKQRDGNWQLTTHLVGRETELAQLQKRLQTVLGGTRQLVFITGEPGIGKTAVVDAFVARLSAKNNVWIGRGQCIEHYGQGEAYLPVLEALGRLCREPEGNQLIDLLSQHAPTWLVQMPTLLTTTDLEALQRRTHGATRERMLRELAEALEVLTVERPLVLWLEDLQWSDVSTLDWLAFVARRREPARLLILGTYRPVEVIVSNHPLKSLKQELQLHGQCDEMALRFLTEEHVTTYLVRRFAISSPASAGKACSEPFDDAQNKLRRKGQGKGLALAILHKLAQLIHQRTEGNPLFMVNLVHYLVSQGVLARVDGQWRLQGEVTAVASWAPESLQQMIEKQIERLSPTEKRVLEVASVAGAEFSAAAAAAGAGIAVETVEEQCGELARHEQFLRTQGTANWPDGTVTARYGFLHALYQDVLYGRLTARQQQRLHQQIGERVEQAYGERAKEIAAELALHFERGKEYHKAIPYLQQAGERAVRRAASQEALAHYNRALALCERLSMAVDPGMLMTIYAGKGAVHVLLSEFLLSVEPYQRMLEVARQLGDRANEAEALYRISFSFVFAHEFDKALDYAEQAKVVASAIGAKNLLASGIFVMGHVYQVTGKLTESARLRAESLRISREVGDKGIEGFSLSQLGMVHNWTGEYEHALQLHEQAYTIAYTHNLPFLLLNFSWMRGLARCGNGEYEQAIASFQEGLELSERVGDKVFKCKILNTLGWVYGELYNLERAIRYNREGVEDSYKVGDPEIIRNAEINLGDYYLLLGDGEQAQQYLEKVYCDSQQRGKWGEEWMKWRYSQHCCHSLGELWLTKGDAEKALKFAEECLQLAEPTESRKNIVKGWRLQGQAFCMQGRLAEAETVLQKALGLAKQIGTPPQLWKTYHALGELYERRGATDQAQAAYSSALEVIEGVASRLQNQEIKQTFLTARPVQEIRSKVIGA